MGSFGSSELDKIKAILIERDYKGEYERFALTPEEFDKEFGAPFSREMPAPNEKGSTYTLQPMIHLWYRTTQVGSDVWNTFFNDMSWGLSEGDMKQGNLAYVRMDLMKSLKDYLPEAKIEAGKITDSARISVTWDSYGIAVDFNYSYYESQGYGESVLFFCEPYADGTPDESAWSAAQDIGRRLQDKYKLPLDISKDEAFLDALSSKKTPLCDQIQSASTRAAASRHSPAAKTKEHGPEM